jgi:hypothetical protein
VLPLRNGAGRGGFDAALSDLAVHHGKGIADSTAKLIGYPVGAGGKRLGIEPRPAVLLAAALAIAVGVGMIPGGLRRRLRRRPQKHAPRRSDPIDTHARVRSTTENAAGEPATRNGGA